MADLDKNEVGISSENGDRRVKDGRIAIIALILGIGAVVGLILTGVTIFYWPFSDLGYYYLFPMTVVVSLAGYITSKRAEAHMSSGIANTESRRFARIGKNMSISVLQIAFFLFVIYLFHLHIVCEEVRNGLQR